MVHAVPVVVGVGQLRANRERTVAGAREPLDLVVDALRLAEQDAGVPGLLARADAVLAVRTASWAYASSAQAVADRVGATPRTLVDTGLGGHWPARLLDQACAAVAAGESEVALVVGGEAQASVQALRRAGVDPVDRGWSTGPGGPPSFDPGEIGSAQMVAAGLYLPTRVYPLFETRLVHDLGMTPQEGAHWSARLYADYSRVAAEHPAAWDPRVRTPEEVATTTRTVCEPYPLSVNAMPHVDQAAAVVVVSQEVARAAGVPEDRLAHVWGGAGADDPADPLRRTDLGTSWALGRALDRCLDRAGVTAEDLDLVDVYSCFPVVPKLAALHLGLPRESVLTVCGGHSSFGGPLNSYSLHAVATAVERVRGSDRLALVHANGGHLTSQHAVLLSGRAHPDGHVGDPEPEQVAHPDAPVLRDAVEVAGTDVVVETATVEHGREGGPRQAFVVGRTPAGERVAAATALDEPAAAASLSLASGRSPVGRTVRLERDGDAAVVRCGP